MSGGADPLYISARTALLDAADALAEQLDALVLVGAQAIYLQTDHVEFAAAEYTTDADFCVSPAALTDAPLLPSLLKARGFSPREHPGAWSSPDGVPVDLMVPEALAGPVRAEHASDPTARERRGEPRDWKEHSSTGGPSRSHHSTLR